MGNNGDGESGRRSCPKHPSEPPFTGFCSACLLDRLHATHLIGLASPPQLPPPPTSLALRQGLEQPPQEVEVEGEEAEAPPHCSTAAAGKRRTTLLRLFQLEDQGASPEDTNTNAAASTSGGDAQDPPPHLQRKRSLRQSCSDWMACCDASAAANHSSCLPSRQSLESDAMAAATVAPAPANPRPNGDVAASTVAAVVEQRSGSLRWNQLWAIRALLAKPTGHLLDRSFSESSRSRYANHSGNDNGNGAIARSSSSHSQGAMARLNGSNSVSSAGNGMDSSEISLPGDSSVGHAHVHRCRPRLKDRLHCLRRSRSVHYPSPTTIVDTGLTPFRSRSISNRSTAHKNHRRFAAALFAIRR